MSTLRPSTIAHRLRQGYDLDDVSYVSIVHEGDATTELTDKHHRLSPRARQRQSKKSKRRGKPHRRRGSVEDDSGESMWTYGVNIIGCESGEEKNIMQGKEDELRDDIRADACECHNMKDIEMDSVESEMNTAEVSVIELKDEKSAAPRHRSMAVDDEEIRDTLSSPPCDEKRHPTHKSNCGKDEKDDINSPNEGQSENKNIDIARADIEKEKNPSVNEDSHMRNIYQNISNNTPSFDKHLELEGKHLSLAKDDEESGNAFPFDERSCSRLKSGTAERVDDTHLKEGRAGNKHADSKETEGLHNSYLSVSKCTIDMEENQNLGVEQVGVIIEPQHEVSGTTTARQKEGTAEVKKTDIGDVTTASTSSISEEELSMQRRCYSSSGSIVPFDERGDLEKKQRDVFQEENDEVRSNETSKQEKDMIDDKRVPIKASLDGSEDLGMGREKEKIFSRQSSRASARQSLHVVRWTKDDCETEEELLKDSENSVVKDETNSINHCERHSSVESANPSDAHLTPPQPQVSLSMSSKRLHSIGRQEEDTEINTESTRDLSDNDERSGQEPVKKDTKSGLLHSGDLTKGDEFSLNGLSSDHIIERAVEFEKPEPTSDESSVASFSVDTILNEVASQSIRKSSTLYLRCLFKNKKLMDHKTDVPNIAVEEGCTVGMDTNMSENQDSNLDKVSVDTTEKEKGENCTIESTCKSEQLQNETASSVENESVPYPTFTTNAGEAKNDNEQSLGENAIDGDVASVPSIQSAPASEQFTLSEILNTQSLASNSDICAENVTTWAGIDILILSKENPDLGAAAIAATAAAAILAEWEEEESLKIASDAVSLIILHKTIESSCGKYKWDPLNVISSANNTDCNSAAKSPKLSSSQIQGQKYDYTFNDIIATILENDLNTKGGKAEILKVPMTEINEGEREKVSFDQVCHVMRAYLYERKKQFDERERKENATMSSLNGDSDVMGEVDDDLDPESNGDACGETDEKGHFVKAITFWSRCAIIAASAIMKRSSIIEGMMALALNASETILHKCKSGTKQNLPSYQDVTDVAMKTSFEILRVGGKESAALASAAAIVILNEGESMLGGSSDTEITPHVNQDVESTSSSANRNFTEVESTQIKRKKDSVVKEEDAKTIQNGEQGDVDENGTLGVLVDSDNSYGEMEWFGALEKRRSDIIFHNQLELGEEQQTPNGSNKEAEKAEVLPEEGYIEQEHNCNVSSIHNNGTCNENKGGTLPSQTMEKENDAVLDMKEERAEDVLNACSEHSKHDTDRSLDFVKEERSDRQENVEVDEEGRLGGVEPKTSNGLVAGCTPQSGIHTQDPLNKPHQPRPQCMQSARKHLSGSIYDINQTAAERSIFDRVSGLFCEGIELSVTDLISGANVE